MKKLLALLLVVVLTFSAGAVAFAAEPTEETPAATEEEPNIVSSEHVCPYCGEKHDDKNVEDSLKGFWHIVLFVFETFKDVFNKVKDMAA